MPTILSQPLQDQDVDWIDLYLSKPIGPSLDHFVATINQYLQENPKDIDSTQLNAKFTQLITQYGRFWIKSGKLYYRTPMIVNSGGGDVEVKRLHVDNHLTKVNGNTVPTITFAQLEVLLKTFVNSDTVDHEFKSKCLEQIRDHQHMIEKAIEYAKSTF